MDSRQEPELSGMGVETTGEAYHARLDKTSPLKGGGQAAAGRLDGVGEGGTLIKGEQPEHTIFQ